VRAAWTRFRNLLDSAFHNVTLGESMLRQLSYGSYEATTISVAIKQRVEPTVEGQRDERRKLSDKITGFTGDYEPACVVDFFTMIEESAPKYLPLSKRVSREQELMSQKVDQRIVVLEDQRLHVKSNAPDILADF